MNVNIVLSFAFDYFLPSLLIWAFISNNADMRVATKYINISFGFVILYGLITHFTHVNPVVDFFKYNNPFPNSKIVFADFSEKIRGNVTGRLQAYYPNAILYGGVVALHLVFCLLYLKPDKGLAFKKSKLMTIITILACILSLFLINSRSSLVCLFASLFVIILLGRLKQSLQIVFLGASTTLIVLTLFSELLADYLPTVNNIFTLGKEGNVSGSSLEMRYTQLLSALQIYSKKPVLGWGFNYIQYLLEAGRTGDLLGAESIVFQVLISGGILGAAAYLFMFSAAYSKLLSRYRKVNRYTGMIGVSLFTGYLAFALLTGDQGLMKFMLIYLALIFKQLDIEYSARRQAPKSLSNLSN
ncbi:MAG: O-antigen ligase family protein [Dyadobacter sp.]|uniref:O-antigen ligase family protein n=1 Tax=Dyadobacter sp. TaxID=1914288 RepID=UPI001B19F811|nr:O-antigen ligase family protein [Dyadobacter sp.]MBO9616380.1 O-antigen ligase family protein [Dyadobacter sp.]